MLDSHSRWRCSMVLVRYHSFFSLWHCSDFASFLSVGRYII